MTGLWRRFKCFYLMLRYGMPDEMEAWQSGPGSTRQQNAR